MYVKQISNKDIADYTADENGNVTLLSDIPFVHLGIEVKEYPKKSVIFVLTGDRELPVKINENGIFEFNNSKRVIVAIKVPKTDFDFTITYGV